MGSVDNANQKRNEYHIPIKSPSWFLFFLRSQMLTFYTSFLQATRHHAAWFPPIIAWQTYWKLFIVQDKTSHSVNWHRSSREQIPFCRLCNLKSLCLLSFETPQTSLKLGMCFVCSDIVCWLLWALYDIENTLAIKMACTKFKFSEWKNKRKFFMKTLCFKITYEWKLHSNTFLLSVM